VKDYAEEISRVTNLAVLEVGIVFEELAKLGVLHGSGNSMGVKGWLSIDINERTFNSYMKFASIDDIIKNFAKEVENKLKEKEIMEIQIDTKKVFVVHGRNWAARQALFTFLRSIGLHPPRMVRGSKSNGKSIALCW
jgi:hypothetical protein